MAEAHPAVAVEGVVVAPASRQVEVQTVTDVTHYGVFSEQAGDPLSVLTFSASGGTERSLGLTVPVNKYYVVDPGQSDFELQDAVVSMSRRLENAWLGWQWRAKQSLTLPLSQYSRDNGRRTRLGMSLAMAHSMGEWGFGTSLSGRYYFNEYKTSVSRDGQGGSPLPWFSYGVSQSVTYSWHRKWEASLAASYSELWFENIGEAESAPWQPEHPYAIDLAATYTPHVGYMGTFGVSQGSRFEQNGRVAFAVFDTYTTTWFIGMTAVRDLAY